MLTNEDLRTIRNPLNRAEHLVDLVAVIFLDVLEVSLRLILSMLVVPQEDETIRAGNSNKRLEWMHCDTANRRVDAAHESVATALTAALDSLEDITLEAANERIGVRHKEVRAAEVLGVASGIFLGLALLGGRRLIKLERRLAVVSLLRLFLRETD